MKWKFPRGGLLVLALLCYSSAHADVIIDGNIFYLSDSYVKDETSSYSRMMWDAYIGINLTKKGSLSLGWCYNSVSFVDPGATQSETNTLTATGMGPKLLYFLDKEHTWSIGFVYDLVLTGKDKTGSADTIELRGTAMKGEFGFTPQISESFYLGLRINYYKGTFAEKIENETTLTKVSYSRTAIYPSISFVMRFE